MVNNGGVMVGDEGRGKVDWKNGGEVMDVVREVKEEGRRMVMVRDNEDDGKIGDGRMGVFDGEIVEGEGNEV